MTTHDRQRLLYSNIFLVVGNIHEIIAGSINTSKHLVWSEIYNNTTELIPSRFISNRQKMFDITQHEKEL